MSFLYFNNDWIAIIPELYLIISINLILVYSVIYSTSPFFDFPLLINNISWLTIQTLIIVLYLNLNNYLYDIVIFNELLIIDLFGNFIKTFIFCPAKAGYLNFAI
jgi:hypothetical protein